MTAELAAVVCMLVSQATRRAHAEVRLPPASGCHWLPFLVLCTPESRALASQVHVDGLQRRLAGYLNRIPDSGH